MEIASLVSRPESPVVIAPRFCGPPAIGNGGYVAGRLAAHLGRRVPIEVTLRRPTPLATRLRARPVGDGRWTLEDDAGDRLVEAAAAPGALADLEPPARPDAACVSRLGAAGGERHPFPGCFVCGPARAPGDGLGILARPMPGAALAAAVWIPARDLADAAGVVAPPFVWAALDCPGYFGALAGSGFARCCSPG